MPTYFFHLGDGKNLPAPGVELADDDAARSEAIVAAGDMLRDLDGYFWSGEEWTMEVFDEAGRRVCKLQVKGSN